ncbi:alpha/beta-hydrolase [Paraphaeosphaeria sporulosa]|uniref:Carboxylic ester hydrolase n=1 Tax=Paraphaeosphaeria sporulosa TaxID=1460663 RepID=A0A177CIN7_9PLEO|nr:alpha/beta-hydrolase [Paraphaeosphaeria sporulosa]OAG06690.1 alpha/beta-hydrolase [Paraphaeosphaeria sporulosa]
MRLHRSALALLAPSALAQIVTVSNGTIHGGSCPSSAAIYYRAIPFAQPPLGPLRFAAPQPFNQKFNGSLDGTKNAPTCIQFGSDFLEPQPWSEDCLFLNVWAPKNASSISKLPVKVWIYGGSNTAGGISDPLYDGCNSAVDSIVVSINYRLGPLGFLGLEDAGLSGNYAVQDLLLGLRWVQENIEAFGGDASKVLLFGQSAGAGLAVVISTLPEAPSLISSVAAESGGGRSSAPYAEAQPYFREFVINLGCALNDLQCVRSKSPEELNAAFPSEPSATITLTYAKGFAPIIDGRIVLEDPAAVGSRVPAIFGSTTADGSSFVLGAYQNNFPPTEAIYTSFVDSNFGPYASTVKAYYPVSRFANISSAALAPYFAMTAIWTHSSYTCSAQRGLKKATENGVPAYAYSWGVAPSCPWSSQFNGVGSQVLQLLSVTHSSEIPFVFRNTEHLPLPNGTCSLSNTENTIGDAVSSAWAAMASGQSPNTPLISDTWPTFSSNGTKGLIATAKGVTIGDIDYSFCKLWDAITAATLATGT